MENESILMVKCGETFKHPFIQLTEFYGYIPIQNKEIQIGSLKGIQKERFV